MWTQGNQLELLENGEEFFPRLVHAIDAAKRDVVVETHTFSEDEIGHTLAEALIRATRRRVRVTLTVDSHGSADLSPEFLERLTHAGIAVRRFPSRPARARTNVFYRLHRKIAVLDHHVAFVGSIDICSRHLRSAGVESMQDYAVRVSGPVVKDILECTRSRAEPRDLPSWQRWRDRIGAVPNVFRLPELDGQVLFVARNDRSRATDIETMYRMGIHNAKRQIVIANGCFCPGYRLLRDLARAARRGVDVKLILQGRRDIATFRAAGTELYDYLLAAGVRIFLYEERVLHAKVAVIDAAWMTVGSSNLDPMSLDLNLEANLFVVDEDLAGELRSSLDALMASSCKEVTARGPKKGLARRVLLLLIYYGARHMPHRGRFALRRSQAEPAL